MSTLEIILGAYSLVMSVLVVFIMCQWWHTLYEWGHTLDRWIETLDGWQETLDLLEAGEQQ